jgi:hypothetical protein
MVYALLTKIRHIDPARSGNVAPSRAEGGGRFGIRLRRSALAMSGIEQWRT